MFGSTHGSRQRLIGRLGVGLALMALFGGAALLSTPNAAAQVAPLDRRL